MGSSPDGSAPLDDDFNDLVFAVRILGGCTMFAADVDDPLLQEAAVQEILVGLWDRSGMNGPVAGRVERGGYIVEKGGEITFQEHQYVQPPSLCQIAYEPTYIHDLRAQGYTVRGQIHTHPVAGGPNVSIPNPGTCPKLPASTYPTLDFPVAGPSNADLKYWREGVADFPGYVLDPEDIYRYEREKPFGPGTPIIDSYELSDSPDACLEEGS